MIRTRINVEGIETTAAYIRATGRELERANRNAVNRTATGARSAEVKKMSSATGVKAKLLRKVTEVKRAGRKYKGVAIIGHSSEGIPVEDYRWRAGDEGFGPTRARIYVAWFDGWKLAAGFVNPRSREQRPLRSRSGGRPISIQAALGPSAAAMFRQGIESPTYYRKMQKDLERETAAQVRKQLARRR